MALFELRNRITQFRPRGRHNRVTRRAVANVGKSVRPESVSSGHRVAVPKALGYAWMHEVGREIRHRFFDCLRIPFGRSTKSGETCHTVKRVGVAVNRGACASK